MNKKNEYSLIATIEATGEEIYVVFNTKEEMDSWIKGVHFVTGGDDLIKIEINKG